MQRLSLRGGVLELVTAEATINTGKGGVPTN